MNETKIILTFLFLFDESIFFKKKNSFNNKAIKMRISVIKDLKFKYFIAYN